jgi:hypothetical protein
MSEKQVQYLQHFRGINNSEATDVTPDFAYNLENLVFDVDDNLLKAALFITEHTFTHSTNPTTFTEIFTFKEVILKNAYESGGTSYDKVIICVGRDATTVYYQIFTINNTDYSVAYSEQLHSTDYESGKKYGAIIVGDTLRLVYWDSSNSKYLSKWWGYITERNIIYLDDGSYAYDNETGYQLYDNTLNTFGISISELTETDNVVEDRFIRKRNSLTPFPYYTLVDTKTGNEYLVIPNTGVIKLN